MSIVSNINASQKARKRKGILIAVLVFVALIGVTILPFFINPKAFYDERDGKVYFGSKELKGINAKDFTTLDYVIGVDCTKVYYKGEPLDFVDRKTFKDLSRGFYADKNGLYFEETPFYSKHKIVPLEGDYDKASFHSLGYQTTLFADKTNLYAIDPFATPPLKKVTPNGMDMATLESLSSYWLKDKAKVYFEDFGDIKVCSEIDAATFEVLSYRVVKDKNKVYYITRDLKTKTKDATERAEYAVLEGADAATFVMINEKLFKDKNQDWVISKEGEKVEYNAPEGRSTKGSGKSSDHAVNDDAAAQARKAAEQAAGR